MNEIIKFRAKRIDNGRWAYGYFVKTPITAEFNDADGSFFDTGVGRYCIIQEGVAHEIDIETLGQFTGLTDHKGQEIYKGDLLRWTEWEQELTEKPDVFDVRWAKFGWVVDCYRSGKLLNPIGDPIRDTDQFEVIGNIYENSELLK